VTRFEVLYHNLTRGAEKNHESCHGGGGGVEIKDGQVKLEKGNAE